MPSLFSLKKDIIKETQAYYNAKSNEDKKKSKENLQRQLKGFHYFRKSNKKDYKLIKKVIENIT
tara:strand:- start:247 stop:438 length:192 start_codon:yes stop_codon:yes gene_type:complete